MIYVRVAYFYLVVAYQAYWVNGVYTRRLVEELRRACGNGRPLSREKVRRMRYYLLLIQIQSGWACALRGYGLSPQERRNAIHLAALTPLADDLTDVQRLTSSDMQAAIAQSGLPGELKHVAYLYRQLMQNGSDHFKKVLHATLAAQDASLAQTEKPALSLPELKKITVEKGGTATLLYRSVLDHPASEKEQAAFHLLGYALQHLNDMFDIHKDGVDRHQTLYSSPANWADCRKEFLATLDLATDLFLQLDYDISRIKKCLLLISVVTARGIVCLAQLSRLTEPGTPVDLNHFRREQLVCDMEKPANIAASFRYSVQVYRDLQVKSRTLR